MATAATPSSIKPIPLLSRFDMAMLALLIAHALGAAAHLFLGLTFIERVFASYPRLQIVYAVIIGASAIYSALIVCRLRREDA